MFTQRLFFRYIRSSLLIWFGGFTAVCAAQPMVLDTPNYRIQITHECAEGQVICERYQYFGISKRSGLSLQLEGKSWHRLCADGVNPCHFMGYQFANGDSIYYFTQAGDLAVINNDGAVLVSEQGRWQSESP